MRNQYFDVRTFHVLPGLCIGLFLLFMPVNVHAVCPLGTNLSTTDKVKRNIRTPRNLSNQALDEGPFSISTSLKLGQGNASIGIDPNDGISTRFSFKVKQSLWKLSVPISSDLKVDDLIIKYSIEDASGNKGYLSSANNPVSRVDVKISERNLTRKENRKNIIFTGFINISGDFENATTSGQYEGRITSTIDCN